LVTESFPANQHNPSLQINANQEQASAASFDHMFIESLLDSVLAK
jgi:hypothetical protein